jgi:Tfp pilus assembly protein PilF
MNERINKLKEFLQASPDDSFLNHALALEYIKLGNDAEAKLLFEKILANQPDYVGSYYHLAKLQERMNDNDAAMKTYEAGMASAKKNGDNHAYNELQAAYEELIY